jgi:hypothetical protein
MKPCVRNMVLYIVAKYVIFYAFMMFKNGNFYLIRPGMKDVSDLLYYLSLFLFVSIMCVLIFSALCILYFEVRREFTLCWR